MEQIDSFIGNSLRSLSIRDRVDSLLAHGGRRRLSEFMNNLQEPQDLVGTEDDDGQNHPRRGVLNSNADQLYVGRRLEDVRGAMSSVARNTPGCRFLVRMVAEGGAAAAQQVLHEVAGDVLRLMVHADGHALVEALVQHLTDDHMACVLQILDAASPAQIVAVARNHQGSSLSPWQCLSTACAVTGRHGCHVMIKCIDMAGVDGEMWSSLVHAVCWDGFALAEHAYGNYVVQHVLRCVPQARASLHAAFRGRYVSLSTQMASSHVVQLCLELFSPEQADEIVGELLGCHHHQHWGCTFQQLISDRFANFVLQTAMERSEIQMHDRLLDAITVHSDELR
ncbi:hypothetical protein SORBI_3004G188900 [Sorghum bicolor]|uniref:PUM-HD domain-containing protein n=1 Tax=Sorghum bicolor TaxID=4558 RepID=A0A194YQI0_SORBI|nr:hypothetical protein SORBI_3004G188900 [Sorghum bicolor]